jgi:hypothetical protein
MTTANMDEEQYTCEAFSLLSIYNPTRKTVYNSNSKTNDRNRDLK